MMSSSTVDTASANAETTWPSTVQEASKVVALLNSIGNLARDEEEYANFLLGIVSNIRACLERAASESGASQLERERSESEDYHKAATSFLLQLGSKLDSEGLYSQNDPAEIISGWRFTSDDVTYFVRLADVLSRKWSKWRSSVLDRENPRGGASPRAPSALYIHRLENLKDRLFPPPILGPWIDITELRRWLDFCDEHHSDHCRLSSRSENTFVHHPQWLIDVHRSCLVRAEPGQQYVALSYVWGTGRSFQVLRENLDRLQESGSLDESSLSAAGVARVQKVIPTRNAILPKTIRDAITLTRQIGESFLWVDSLCIVQDNYEEKEEHLRCMGSIYANAYVTIAATGGTAPNGLRGIEDVTPPMKRKIPEARYARHEESLRRKIQYHHDVLLASVWNNRAWTFQEQIFSRRLLIFGETEVSWECHCTLWFEGMDVVEGQCQNNTEVVAQGFSFAMPVNFWDYACHVEQYNRRVLTYPEDALDAFGGIITTLSTVFIGGFICGLPRMFLDAALLWYNKSPLEKRRAVRDQTRAMPPTWAWAAWGGAVAFRDHAKTPNSIEPLVQWKYRKHSQDQWQLIISDQNQLQSIAQSAGELESCTVEESTQKDRGNGRGAAPVPRRLNCYSLFSQPLRSFFRIGEIYGRLQVLLAKSAGMLTSCEALSADARNQLCEVVAISAVSGADIYNVLWIAWHHGIAHRKGAGWVTRSAWSSQTSEPIDLTLE